MQTRLIQINVPDSWGGIERRLVNVPIGKSESEFLSNVGLTLPSYTITWEVA